MPSDALLPKCELTNSSRVRPEVAAHSAYWRHTAASSSGVSESVPGQHGAVPVAARDRDRGQHGRAGAFRHRVAQRVGDDRVGADRQVRTVLLGGADGDESDLAVTEVALRGELRPRQFRPSARRHEAKLGSRYCLAMSASPRVRYSFVFAI